MGDQEEYAKLAHAAYGKKDVDGYTLDKELSNDNRSVYVKDGKAVVSFRGTHLSGGRQSKWDDIGTDALLSLGLQDLSSRFRNAKHTTNKAIDKYGKDNVSLTGHSLGGSQALYVHTKTALPTHAYNPGVSPIDVARSKGFYGGKLLKGMYFRQPTFQNNAHSYITRNDLVGGLSRHVKGLNTHLVNETRKNPHSILNFF